MGRICRHIARFHDDVGLNRPFAPSRRGATAWCKIAWLSQRMPSRPCPRVDPVFLRISAHRQRIPRLCGRRVQQRRRGASGPFPAGRDRSTHAAHRPGRRHRARLLSPDRQGREVSDRRSGICAAHGAASGKSRKVPAGAILEGIASIEALGYRRLAELGAPALVSMRTVGGGSRNPAWTRIRARKLGVPFIEPISSEAAYGAALLAMRAWGG